MKNVSRVRYYVGYGSCGSRQPCNNLADVLAFISHCLKEGTAVNAVTKA